MTYGFATRLKLPGASKVADVVLSSAEATASTKVLHGKAHFYLKTGLVPESLIPKPAPTPAQLRRAREKKLAAARAAKAKADEDARIVADVRARIEREQPPLPVGRMVSVIRVRQMSGYVSTESAAAAKAAAKAAAERVRQEEEAQMLKIVRRGTERLCTTLADVKRTAYEWQSSLDVRSSALRHGASTQGAVGGAEGPSVRWADQAIEAAPAAQPHRPCRTRPATAEARRHARPDIVRPSSAHTAPAAVQAAPATVQAAPEAVQAAPEAVPTVSGDALPATDHDGEPKPLPPPPPPTPPPIPNPA